MPQRSAQKEPRRTTYSFYNESAVSNTVLLFTASSPTPLSLITEADLDAGSLEKAVPLEYSTDRLRTVTEDIPLPKQDLHFRFRKLDQIEAEKREGVRSRPSLRGFGWIPIYSGKDNARFEDIQTSLRLAGIPFKPMRYSSAQRLTVQAMQNANTFQSRGPSINPTAKLQLDNLSKEELDMYTVEVRKKDMERARTALRELK